MKPQSPRRTPKRAGPRTVKATTPRRARRLTPRERRFVEEYLTDLNATQAAIRAGYSKRTAHSIAHSA